MNEALFVSYSMELNATGCGDVNYISETSLPFVLWLQVKGRLAKDFNLQWKMCWSPISYHKMLPFPYVEPTMPKWWTVTRQELIEIQFPSPIHCWFSTVGSPIHRRCQSIRKKFVYFDSHRKLFHSTHVRVANAPWNKN